MTTRNRIALAAASVIIGGVAAWLWLGRSSPPQLPASDEVFKSVDALFTAVTARDQQLLAACQGRLAAQKDRQQLPAEVAARLDQIIAQANDGQWEASARALNDFMLGQKRAGEPVKPRPKQPADRVRR